MIYSRRRVYAVFKLLRDEGVPLEDLLRVHAPIGLDIKTETPGEIAISVGAELLRHAGVAALSRCRPAAAAVPLLADKGRPGPLRYAYRAVGARPRAGGRAGRRVRRTSSATNANAFPYLHTRSSGDTCAHARCRKLGRPGRVSHQRQRSHL